MPAEYAAMASAADLHEVGSRSYRGVFVDVALKPVAAQRLRVAEREGQKEMEWPDSLRAGLGEAAT